MANIRLFYEEDSVVLQEPELRLIARAAHNNIHEVELLLILLLGCAVKCPNKRHFIEKITRFDDDTKAAIAVHVKKVRIFLDTLYSISIFTTKKNRIKQTKKLNYSFFTGDTISRRSVMS